MIAHNRTSPQHIAPNPEGSPMMPSDISDVMRPIRAAYYRQVRDIAVGSLEIAAQGGDPDRFIQESVDGSSWVIYDHAAKAVWMVSDNADAWDDMGAGEASGIGQIAAAAMDADVRELLSNEYFQREHAPATTDAEDDA